MRPCPDCYGKGRIPKTASMVDSAWCDCTRCKGTGILIEKSPQELELGRKYGNNVSYDELKVIDWVFSQLKRGECNRADDPPGDYTSPSRVNSLAFHLNMYGWTKKDIELTRKKLSEYKDVDIVAEYKRRFP